FLRESNDLYPTGMGSVLIEMQVDQDPALRIDDIRRPGARAVYRLPTSPEGDMTLLPRLSGPAG
ncbi:MAG: hypothetical protein OEV53_11390, partial [Nitrospira sp.]|nr:hypothetical protein [Nitrospira sp.]